MKETPPSSCYGDRPEESSPQTCRLAQALGLTAAIAVVGVVETVPAADQPTIPIIVQDTTMFFWQIVLAGARKVGSELNVNVPELGTQSDIDGQISILENAVSGKPRGYRDRLSESLSRSLRDRATDYRFPPAKTDMMDRPVFEGRERPSDSEAADFTGTMIIGHGACLTTCIKTLPLRTCCAARCPWQPRMISSV
jgi:hypothetical protein